MVDFRKESSLTYTKVIKDMYDNCNYCENKWRHSK